MSTGIYTTQQKNGSIVHRVSITYKRKHISLGTFRDKEIASIVYAEAKSVLADNAIVVDSYNSHYHLSHDKFISLINFRDNNIYIPTPVYLKKGYFEYYLSSEQIMKFDRDDLFFYASHKIQQRGGYLFVCDYGSQYKILSRYGIRPFAVYGRDYIMINGDKLDYRYSNIKIINRFTGVKQLNCNGVPSYNSYIHVNGNYNIGTYQTEIEAAIAYNKAVDTLQLSGFSTAFIKNYIPSLSRDEYTDIYKKVKISKKLLKLRPD